MSDLEGALVPAPEFDLALTLGSGQVFHWMPDGAGFLGAIDDVLVRVEPRDGALLVSPGREAALVAHYFALDHDLAQVRESFPANDAALARAADACRGMRLIRQPLWECLATFITSSMKQVAHIRAISLTLRERYGATRTLGAATAFAYPSAARIAALEERDLRDCALGYRAANLLATARAVASGAFSLEAFGRLDRAAAEAALRALPGVGPKVANCVLLFGGGHLAAFPIDVWIERALRTLYFPGRRRPPAAGELRDFAARRFGSYGGYAQQYLFHWMRVASVAET